MPQVRDPEGQESQYLGDFLSLSGARVLEIGCGDGRLTRQYADYAAFVAGIDPDWERLAGVRETPLSNAGFARASALALPFAAGAFDCAILAWSL